MLTLDLLRYKISEDYLEPFYIKPQPGSRYFRAAEALLHIYRTHVGKTRSELEAALDDFIGADVHYKVYRGLAKILEDSSVIETACLDSQCDPGRIRMRLFTTLKKLRPVVRTPDLLHPTSAEQAFRAVASDLGMDPQTLDAALYADLRENHVVKGVDGSLTARLLIERYNVALAQAMLFRAVRAEIRVREQLQDAAQMDQAGSPHAYH